MTPTLPDRDAIDTGKGEARRAQVLGAASICFRKHGFHGTSIQELSEEAGMSPGHIYHYFQNKEAIVAGIVERDLRDVLDDVRRVENTSAAEGVVEACLSRVAAGAARNADPEHRALWLEIMAEATRNPTIAAMIHDADRRVRERIRAVVRQLPSARALPPRELEARLVVMGSMIDGLVIRTLCNPDSGRPATVRVIQRVVRFLLEDGESSTRA